MSLMMKLSGKKRPKTLFAGQYYKRTLAFLLRPSQPEVFVVVIGLFLKLAAIILFKEV
jgi:hypothetical protein